MVDWGAGSYERTAAELEPVSEAVVDRAMLSGDVDVIDVACGTGNSALLAAGRGAPVVGIDGSPRLLEVARERARAQGLEIDFREGDLADLPVASATADLVVSVFGLIFAPEPGRALREVSRLLRPGGRMLMTAWIPAGPIDAMIEAIGRIVGRVSQAPRPARFAWSDPDALGPLAAEAGLTLQATMPALLTVRDRSPERGPRRISRAQPLRRARPSPPSNARRGAESDSGRAIALQANGQVVLGGSHFFGGAGGFGLARVNSNRALDQTFGSHGTVITNFQGSDGVNAIAVQPDGKIFAVGVSFSSGTGQEDVALARYLP